ncbi:MAG TPA: ribbon-helix-helix protein, CopG family [Myxococcaceae bacterium]|nr:ribbon-helix-helix protein, CopG family [Myxococcaceae bacterium]
MHETLTIRLSSESLRALRERARSEGKTPSEMVRTLIENEAPPAGPSAYDLTRQWVGSVRSKRRVALGRNARKLLRQWNPDRRG